MVFRILFVLGKEALSYAMHPDPTFKNYAKPVAHRRRIKTEAKAKVVSSVQGTEFIQFLAALAVVH